MIASASVDEGTHRPLRRYRPPARGGSWRRGSQCRSHREDENQQHADPEHGTAIPSCARAEITVHQERRARRHIPQHTASTRKFRRPPGQRQRRHRHARRNLVVHAQTRRERGSRSPRSSAEAHFTKLAHHGRSELTWRRAAPICSRRPYPTQRIRRIARQVTQENCITRGLPIREISSPVPQQVLSHQFWSI